MYVKCYFRKNRIGELCGELRVYRRLIVEFDRPISEWSRARQDRPIRSHILAGKKMDSFRFELDSLVIIRSRRRSD